jgi:Ca-activated chloride channel family protein
MGILDLWMEQVEGDPSYLLRNQFMLEEAQYMRSRGGPLHETRPW